MQSIPIAPINTLSEVPPAEINGIGMPVGGIEPETTAMLRIVWIEIIAAIPKQRNAENLLFERIPIMKILTIKL